MSAEPEPDAGFESPEPSSPPAQTRSDESEKKTGRAVDASTRSARYVLTTAVTAAIISSFVSAGTAVYVSLSTSNRAEQQAISQVVHADRQNVYSDFSVALFDYTEQVALLLGKLQTRQPIEAVRPQILNLSNQQAEFLAGLNLLLMAGSLGMQEIGGRFADAVLAFTTEHLRPFNARYLDVNAPGSNDVAARERDSVAMVNALEAFTVKIGELNGAFVEQGSRDLQERR